jgi:hypothetical protein
MNRPTAAQQIAMTCASAKDVIGRTRQTVPPARNPSYDLFGTATINFR